MSKSGSVVILFLLFTCNVSAQIRTIQIVQEFLKPLPNQNIFARSYQDLEVKITNLGPDTIFATDYYAMFFTYGGVITFPDFGNINQIVPPNGSYSFLKKFYFGFSYSVDSVSFCSSYELYSRTDTLLDVNYMEIINNKACVIENFIDTFMVGVDDLNVPPNFDVYPNPFKDYLSINLNGAQIKRFELMDMYGNIMPLYINALNLVTGDFTAIAKGTYFLFIETDNGVILTKKLLKI